MPHLVDSDGCGGALSVEIENHGHLGVLVSLQGAPAGVGILQTTVPAQK